MGIEHGKQFTKEKIYKSMKNKHFCSIVIPNFKQDTVFLYELVKVTDNALLSKPF